ncbi:MAG: methyltransferase domain-containing protein [Ignavibacteria bacterium]|nr:methyltransferase domain-containing protein [Ignavibacteria bacterium]
MSQEELLNPDQINALAYSFQKSRVLLTAAELKIFSILDKHLLPSDEVAKKINSDPRATDRLMNALVAIGLMRKVHGKFYNTETAAKYLVEGKPDFMSGLLFVNNLWNSWSNLTEAVKKGKSLTEKSIETEDWLNSFIAAMHYRADHHAKIIGLMLELGNVKKMLDVGGGSGAFSYEFMKINPQIESVIFDVPEVINLTKKYADDNKLTNKIKFIEGDYLIDDFGSGYDLILLSAVIHINSSEQNKALINKCSEALNTGGQIVIKDFVMNEDRAYPVAGALFSLNMLVNTESGDTYTENEIKEWLLSSGIQNIEKKKTSFGSDLIIGKK